jgi:hypothetical protein
MEGYSGAGRRRRLVGKDVIVAQGRIGERLRSECKAFLGS